MVKGYAALKDLTVAEALQLLISRGIAVGVMVPRDPALGVLRDMPDPVLAELVKRVAEETARRNALSTVDQQKEEAERLNSIGLGQPQLSAQDVELNKLMAEFLRGANESVGE
jgi:hypothetical protein